MDGMDGIVKSAPVKNFHVLKAESALLVIGTKYTQLHVTIV